MSLTETVVKNSKPREKPYKLSDEKGLYVQVNPNGSKLWHLKYRFADKEKRLAFGPHPTVTVNGALRRLGYATDEEMTGHGFRAMARTILDEVLGFRVEWIDMQLAHKVKDPNDRAYNRTAFLNDQKEMMQSWADYLDELRRSAPDLAQNTLGSLSYQTPTALESSQISTRKLHAA
jgi:integrase